MKDDVISDGLVQRVDEEVRENRRFRKFSLTNEFPQVLSSVFYEIVVEVEKLFYLKRATKFN